MNLVVLFTLLLCFGSSPQVNSVFILDTIYGFKNWILGPPAPVPDESSLVLAVEKDGRTYLANNGFVTNQMDNIYREFLFACPSEPGSSQANINEENSETKNALFIEKTYEKPKVPGKNLEFVQHKCKSPVKPSIIRTAFPEEDQDIEYYLIGYEIYLDKDNNKSYKIDAFETVKLKDNNFVWFNLYTIAFDRKQGNVVNVFSPVLAYKNHQKTEATFTASASRGTRPAQTDLPFGKEIFYEKNSKITQIYGMENQKKVFQGLFGDSGPLEYSDSIQERFLGEVHLAPLDYFRIPLWKQAAQTYGNMAPMWNLVYENAWQNLEKHIGFLAKGLKAIHVITGAYETLKIHDKYIYLGPENTVKVPAAFFKIVSYSPYSLKNAKRIYNMLIIVSNNPYDENDRINDRICPENQCQEYGWEHIQQDYYPMGRTSCCQLTKQNLHELKLAHMDELIDETLDLTDVPHWSEDDLTLNLKLYILDQIEKESDLPADDNSFKNALMLIGQDHEEFSFSRFLSIMYTNIVELYFTKKV